MTSSIQRWLAYRWHLVASLAVLAYFTYHAVQGPRGLLAWAKKEAELAAAGAELARLQAEIADYAAKVEALQPDRADPDMVEEQLRELGFIARGEVIVLPAGERPPQR